MPNNNDTVKTPAARIMYVEPNDMEGTINGTPITPDYTDFCISFDLVVDVVTRLRNNNATLTRKQKSSGDDSGSAEAMKSFVLSWTSQYKPNDKSHEPEKVSFMAGESYGDKRNYLTTYYVDSHYNEFKNKTIVEGLGVESVNISFESYYTPTVKIRFIDVRGMSLFGREEVLHTDEVLAEDNIWGCFFTFPYPKYKLQVKGFYGKAVTYQLTCSDFRANFNPATGNFEIDVTFLGYDFGLLTDVPMQYIIAAPFCDYADTRAYWNKNKSSEDWKMDNGDDARDFYYIRRKIAAAIEKYDSGDSSQVATSEEVEVEVVDEERKEALDKVKDSFIELEKAIIEADFNGGIDKILDDEGNEIGRGVKQYAPSSNQGVNNRLKFGKEKLTQKTREEWVNTTATYKHPTREIALISNYNVFYDAVKEYIEKYEDNGLKESFVKWNNPNETEAKVLAVTKGVIDGLTKEAKEKYQKQIQHVNGEIKNSNFKYNIGNPNSLIYIGKVQVDKTWSWKKEDQLCNYKDLYYDQQKTELPVVGISYEPLQNFEEILKEEYQNHTSSVIGETRSITPSRTYKKETIQELVGFKPTIGNLFRTIYCHLETFAHMIYTCAKNINSQIERKERDLNGLGLTSFEMTDIDASKLDNNQIPPFPGVYIYQKDNGSEQQQETRTVGEEEEDVTVDSWPGELNKEAKKHGAWEEELLVDALFRAVLHVKAEGSDSAEVMRSTKYPILPSDLNREGIAGVGMFTEDKDATENLAGYLALRAAAIFGMSNYGDNEAESVGKADAINYYESIGVKDTIKKGVLEALEGDKAEALYQRALCKGEFATKNKMPFEIGQNIAKNGRQPFFEEENGNLKYCYAVDEKKNAFVPSRLSSWGDINNELEYEGAATNSYYKFKTINQHSDVLYNRYTSYMLGTIPDITDDDKKLYLNDEIFTIYYGGKYGNGEAITKKIEEKYEALKDGAINLNGYVKESDPDLFKTLLKNHWLYVSPTDFEAGYNLKEMKSLYPNLETLDIDEKDLIDENGVFKIFTNEFRKKIENKNVSISNGEFRYNDKIIEGEKCETLIPQLEFFGTTNDVDKYTQNVFTSNVYLFQNEKNLLKPASGETFKCSTREFAKKASKAILFLMSIYNNDVLRNKIFTNDLQSGRIQGCHLPELLVYGGFLWRKEFIDCNKVDPILSEFAEIKKLDLKKGEIPMVFQNGKYIPGFIKSNSSGLSYSSYASFFGNIDQTISNQLVKMFKDFVNGSEWENILKSCELVDESGAPLSMSHLKNMDEKTKVALLQKKNNGKYCYIAKYGNDTTSLFSILAEDNPALGIIKKLYLGKVIVQRTIPSFTGTNGTISIKSTTFKNYLNGFIKQMTDICNSETQNVVEDITPNNEDDDENNEDIKRSIYMFVKNLWDRWFSANSENLFTVKNFMQNTIFIDSMYRNVYDKIHINCEILEDLLNSSDGKSMVFKFMSDITTKHHCMFFAMPDYLDLGNPSNTTAMEGMESLFKPLPYTKINEIATMNKFIIMFTHPPSKQLTDSNSYKYDSFDIYSHDETDKYILKTFKSNAVQAGSETLSEHDLQCTRYGYNVPAFGVSFGRQNNAIFKKVGIGMENPVQTSEAINALSLIASRGRGSGERTIFYGQDLYPVYAGYSYTATVEMMGNAQIMPLMYFQLFNIPMFRGAYMIYQVTHTMRPGDMTTTFKAMKMSKHTLPWCQEWYSHYYFDAEGNILDSYDDECGALIGGGISSDYPWMKIAYGLLNEGLCSDNNNKSDKQFKGLTDNKYFKPGGLWCAGFVTYCLTQANVNLTSSGGWSAPAYKNYGTPLKSPSYGAIALCYWDKGNAYKNISHVGFVAGKDKNGNIIVLGGNQSHCVTLTKNTSQEARIEYCMPPGYSPNGEMPITDVCGPTYGEGWPHCRV